MTKSAYWVEQNDTVTKLNFIEYFPLSMFFFPSLNFKEINKF